MFLVIVSPRNVIEKSGKNNVPSVAYKDSSYFNEMSLSTSMLPIITSDFDLTKYSYSVTGYFSSSYQLCVYSSSSSSGLNSNMDELIRLTADFSSYPRLVKVPISS